MTGWRTLCHPAYRRAQMGEREAPNTRTDVTYPSWAMPAAVVAIAMLDFENKFYIRYSYSSTLLLLCTLGYPRMLRRGYGGILTDGKLDVGTGDASSS